MYVMEFKKKVQKLIFDTKFLYLQDSFLTDDLIAQQIKHALDKRNLKTWEVEDQLVMTY